MPQSTLRVVYAVVLYFSTMSQADSLGLVDRVPLSSGGEWSSSAETHLAINTSSNRLVSVVREMDSGGKHGWKALSFDASTNAPSSQEWLNATDQLLPLGLVVSASSNRMVINWGVPTGSSERQIPSHIEIFNLATFSRSDSIQLPLPLAVMDMDQMRNRLVALGDPPGSPETAFFSIITINLDNLSVSSSSTSFLKENAIAKDAVFDPTMETLFVLFAPTEMGDPDVVKNEGFIARFDVSTGAVVSSATFTGEFTPHSLAYSPLLRRLAVAPSASGQRRIPLIDADTMNLLPPLTETSFSNSFESGGSAVFADPHHLWINNAVDSASQQSILSVDISHPLRHSFISNATESLSMLADQGLNKIYIASERLDSLYVLSATSTTLTTQVDVTVKPADLLPDPVTNNWLLLSDQGRLYVVADRPLGASDTVPRFVARYPGFGAGPRAGLVPDQVNGRLIVARSPSSRPRVLEREGFQEMGEIPAAAEALVFNASRNLIYSVGSKTGIAKDGQVLKEVDGYSLSLIRDVMDLSDILMPPGDPIFGQVKMAADVHTDMLWLLAPGFLMTGPSLQRIDPVAAAREIFRFPYDSSAIPGNLLIDTDRQRILMTLDHQESVEIETFDFSSFPPATPSSRFDLHAQDVWDSAADLESGLVYYLVESLTFTELIVFDLESDAVLARVPLPFLRYETAMNIAFNPKSNRFAVSSSPAGSLFLFDNPFTEILQRRMTKDTQPRVSVSPFDVGSGMGISWRVDDGLQSEIAGWIIERKEQITSPETVPDEWICLSPIQLPANLTWWNDTTAEKGIPYLYRVRANTKSSNRVKSATIGPLVRDSSSPTWGVNIPVMATLLLPGSEDMVSVAITSSTKTVRSVSLHVETADPVIAQVSRTKVLLPGVSSLIVSVTESALPGTYPVIVSMSDEQTLTMVPLLVRVVDQRIKITTHYIFRQPVPIFLSSDSSLTTRRISIRGQVGILRRNATPTGIVIRTRLPNGEILSATGIVAPTGEFTTEIPVSSLPLNGNWLIRATWPGSFESAGGSSQPFHIPVFNESNRKDDGAEHEIGQVVAVSGKPPQGTTLQVQNTSAQRIYDTFLSKRIKGTNNQLFSSITMQPSLSNLRRSLEEKSSNPFVLLYLLGDASKTATGLEFILSATESINMEDLRSLIESIPQGTQPLLILDTPYAGDFQETLSGQLGAHIFSCQPDFRPIHTGLGGFTDWYLYAVRSGSTSRMSGFGGAFLKASAELSRLAAAEGSLPQIPSANRATQEPFLSLQVGSDFTPSRSLIQDRIPPRIESVSASKQVTGETQVEVVMTVTDLPFDLPVTAYVDVVHPNGWIETIELKQSSENIHSYSNMIWLLLPGQTKLVYTARDFSGNMSQMESSIELISEPSGPGMIFQWLSQYSRISHFDLSSFIFWMQLHWQR